MIRPILFSGEMVRAILDGRKTQTRRVVSPQPELFTAHGATCMRWKGKINTPLVIAPSCMAGMSPYGKHGDRLWVRETWLSRPDVDDELGGMEVLYRATDNVDSAFYGGWRPSIFMPRDACRIVLEITEVRVERVQDICEQDAIAEGIERFSYRRGELSPYVPMTANEAQEVQAFAFGTEKLALGVMDTDAVYAYRRLWDSINAKRGYGWKSNPWVWVVEFKQVES